MRLLDNKYNFSRINEIIKVLVKYGFDGAAQKLSDKTIKYVPVDKFVSNKSSENVNVRIRLVLQELGTTFIKLGQTLSTYPELIGFDLANELSKLQESAPIDSYEEIKDILESEFSKPVDDIFEEFSIEPIASASIGQVHTAYLNNKCVAVKVQHPDIYKTVKSDIDIMRIIANRLNNYVSSVKSYNLPGLVDVFEKDIFKELDYKFEAMNAIHLSDLLKDDEVYIPKIYLDYSTDKVLTMEFLNGVSLNSVFDAPNELYDKEKIALIGADSYIKQILIHGFYHADPHPGNIFVLEGDIVAFVDFGMMGHLDNSLRDNLSRLFIYISEGDAKLLTKQLYYMGIIKNKDYYKDIEYEIMNLLDRYYGSQFDDVSGVFRGLVQDDILNKYDVIIPRDLMLVVRTISMIEDAGKRLDPSFNTTEILKPYIYKMVFNNFKPKHILSKVNEKYMDIHYLGGNISEFLINFFKIVDDDGNLKIVLELDEIEKINTIVSRLVNELVLAIIIAALLIGSSLIMMLDKGFLIFGYPFLGFIGFVFSAVLGIILIIMIIRRGNYL